MAVVERIDVAMRRLLLARGFFRFGARTLFALLAPADLGFRHPDVELCPVPNDYLGVRVLQHIGEHLVDHSIAALEPFMVELDRRKPVLEQTK